MMGCPFRCCMPTYRHTGRKNEQLTPLQPLSAALHARQHSPKRRGWSSRWLSRVISSAVLMVTGQNIRSTLRLVSGLALKVICA